VADALADPLGRRGADRHAQDDAGGDICDVHVQHVGRARRDPFGQRETQRERRQISWRHHHDGIADAVEFYCHRGFLGDCLVEAICARSAQARHAFDA